MRILNILIDCLICEIGGILYEKNLGAKPYLFPQPVMIIASYDEHGKANAMNAASEVAEWISSLNLSK